MRILFYLLPLFFFVENDDLSLKSDEHYEAAVKHVRELPDYKSQNITVSSEFNKVSLASFYSDILELDQFSEYKNLPQLQALSKLDTIDLEMKSMILDKKINSSKFNTEGRSDYVLYFSARYKNIVTAELFKYNGERGLEYSNNARYTESKVFLFVFNSENKIDRVFVHKCMYD